MIFGLAAFSLYFAFFAGGLVLVGIAYDFAKLCAQTALDFLTGGANVSDSQSI